MRTGMLCVPVLIGLLSGCDESAEVKARREQAHQQAVKTGEAVGEYTEAVKNELYEKNKAELHALDRKLDEFREKAKTAMGEAKERMDATLKDLEAKREGAGKHLDELAAKGKEAWGEVKVGMNKVTEDLKTAIHNAAKTFEEPKQPAP